MAASLRQQLAIVVLQGLEKHAQHRFHDVDHAQHLARCVGERDAGRAERGRIDVLRFAGIIRDGADRQEPRAQPRQRVQKADKDNREARLNSV